MTEQKKEELTFLESDVNEFANFMNFVYKNASFKLTHEQFRVYERLYGKMAVLLKKMESHIMENPKVVHMPKKDEDKK